MTWLALLTAAPAIPAAAGALDGARSVAATSPADRLVWLGLSLLAGAVGAVWIAADLLSATWPPRGR